MTEAVPSRSPRLPLLRSAWALLAGLVLGLSGCSGGDSTGPGDTTPQPTPAFTLSAAPTSLSVVQGAQGTVTVSVARSGGFTGAVSVAVEGLPGGVTASALSVAGNATSGTLTLSAGAQAAAGSATLTLRGTGSGVEARTATVNLSVEAAPSPDFQVGVGTSTLELQAGSSAQVAVNLTRSGGFTGAVQLSATGLPSGVSASFDPVSPTGASGNASTLTLTAAQGAATGTVEVQVRGNAQGVGERAAPLALTVTAPPPPTGEQVTWDFCGASGLAAWVAVRDGDGPWNRVSGTGHRYTFQLSQDRGGVAWAVPEEDGGWELQVMFASRDELVAHGGERCPHGPGPGRTFQGTVAGMAPLPAIETAFIAMGGALPEVAPTSFSTAFALNGVGDGSVDLLATAAGISTTTGSVTPRKMILRRGINPAAGSPLPVLDFGAGEAFDPVTRSVSVTGSGGDALVATSLFWTGSGTQGVTGVDMVSGTTGSWFGLPSDRVQSGDVHMVSASAVSSLTDPFAPSRTTVRLLAQAENVTLPIGPHLATVTPTAVAAAGHRRFRLTTELPTEYGEYWFGVFQQGSSPSRLVQVQMTRAWRGSGTGTLEIEIPDFAGVDGWDPTYGLREGAAVVWTLSAVGWSGGPGIPTNVRVPGFEYRSASRQGEVP